MTNPQTDNTRFRSPNLSHIGSQRSCVCVCRCNRAPLLPPHDVHKLLVTGNDGNRVDQQYTCCTTNPACSCVVGSAVAHRHSRRGRWHHGLCVGTPFTYREAAAVIGSRQDPASWLSGQRKKERREGLLIMSNYNRTSNKYAEKELKQMYKFLGVTTGMVRLAVQPWQLLASNVVKLLSNGNQMVLRRLPLAPRKELGSGMWHGHVSPAEFDSIRGKRFSELAQHAHTRKCLSPLLSLWS